MAVLTSFHQTVRANSKIYGAPFSCSIATDTFDLILEMTMPEVMIYEIAIGAPFGDISRYRGTASATFAAQASSYCPLVSFVILRCGRYATRM